MYQLHIANKNYSSWSLRSWILMKELNISFEEILHPFHDQKNWHSYKKINPSGLVPCLVHLDEIIWDSLSITEFLAEKHSDVWPQNDYARHWAKSVTSEMHSGFSSLCNICGMNCGVRVKLTQISSSLENDINRIDYLWQTGLDKFGGPFLTGNSFCAVDAFYAPVALRFQTYGISLSTASTQYMTKLLSLEFMQLWYKQALEEPYRDAIHEEETTAFGKMTADLRKLSK